MPFPRIVILLVALIVVLGLLLWLFASLSQLLWQLSYTSPLLADVLLFLIIALVVLLIGVVIYYIAIVQRGERRSRRRAQRQIRIPEERTDAAEENLRAIQQQLTQIQDEVARQALLERSREIEASLSRGALQVVVFGTGSAGKTSLVNAIFGRIVGQVAAPMGTTQEGQTYSLRLKGMERKILITDTPGILEAGVAGTERERLARQLATEADLLLFVVDNDLRRSEYEPLQTLAEIGKRSLLVLNKTDLYTDEDRETILAQLRERVKNFIAPTDIVAIAANPQPVTSENGEVLHPEPNIMPLLRRMAAVLRAEGEELVADNILLQSQRLGEEARQIIDAQRRRQADKVVERFQWISAGVVSVTPLPGVDLLATAAVNAQMVVEIGRIYGCELNLERGKELALSLAKTLASLGIVKGAIQILSTALQFHVATFVVGKAIQGVTAAYLTRIAGKSFIEYFRHDQDWGDGGITEVVQRQFQLNRRDEFIKVFAQEAIARVIKPLKVDS
ncbi:GTP-binding protein [Gloeocapsopsis crepidinum LEGE 06123]|uniref:GTP-binding protein n=1 Tax=Gloeocapsopsis crepidinum LEGE 06123 TaxID=588587 RepID=A0ABR9UNC9_9CHRO|nr:GTP-binding protein [Gloeocapsopsis crepidinum]MBE9189798.1 GTP-binding protein [Gloeocapsopsis crepidinum LEGE 06123]